MCLRVEASCEVGERLPVVEALLLEEAVVARLDSAFEWIEDDSGNDDSGQQSVDAQAGQAGGDGLCGECDRTKGHADQCSRRQRVGHAALEDQNHVPQAITDDSPT